MAQVPTIGVALLLLRGATFSVFVLIHVRRLLGVGNGGKSAVSIKCSILKSFDFFF